VRLSQHWQATAFASAAIVGLALTMSGVPASAAVGAHVRRAGAPVPSTLVIDQSGAPATLDPGLQWDTESYEVYRNIFDQLLARNPKTNAIEPDVATKWKSVTPTEWQFTIRSGIKFTNGEPLTAADVSFSLNRIINPALKSAQAANFEDVTGATASGNVVTIKTKVPDPLLLSYLHILSIVPMKYVQAHGNTYFNLHPIGSGPYELQQWIQGSKVVLTRNAHYWGKKGIFQTVVFRNVPDPATELADLQSGTADLVTGLTPDQVASVKSNPSLKVLPAPSEFVQLLMFNDYEAPTNNVNFRKAVSDAINVPLLIKTVLDGFGAPVKETLVPGVFGYNPSEPGYHYNPKQAKALLKAAHYHGQPVIILTAPFFSTTLLQAIQSELVAVGINAKIQSYAGPTYLSLWQNPKHNWGNLNVTDWSCSCEDASGLLTPLYTTGSIWSAFNDPTLTKIIDAAQSTTNVAARTKDINAALARIQAEMAGMGLWQQYLVYGENAHLQWTPDLPQDMFVNTMSWK